MDVRVAEDVVGLPAAEPQEVREVTVSPHRPNVSVATVLERAALYIEEFGWVQGGLGNMKRGFCAIGALRAVGSTRLPFDDWQDFLRLFHRTFGSIIVFNDAPGRTAAEVTAALREAARRVRDAGEATR